MKHLNFIFLVNILFFVFTNIIVAKESYNWSFPKDHGAHKRFNTEWWYFTGHLESEKNQVYGFELTFFKFQPNIKQTLDSSWALDSIYLAHFALTDESKKKFYVFERLNRSSFNMAGASENTLNVWNGDWSVALEKKQIKLEAVNQDIGLSLRLNNTSPIILQGDKGFSKKNPQASQWSYYYSMPRLEGRGTLQLGKENILVKKASVWFDHEFFHSKLDVQKNSAYQQSIGSDFDGWDWFALQLNNKQNIMLARVRGKAGKHNDYFFGTLSDETGKKEVLTQKDFKLKEISYWKSPKTDIRYPSVWKLDIPKLNLDVVITPTLKNQELKLKHLNQLSYWEGRCIVEGSHKGQAYIELVGYE